MVPLVVVQQVLVVVGGVWALSVGNDWKAWWAVKA